LKPWKNKIDAILHMGRPWNATELCMFIRCINYYHDRCPSHAQLLNLWLINQDWRNMLLLNGLMRCNKHFTKCAWLWPLML
jgi:hypothetical protein